MENPTTCFYCEKELIHTKNASLQTCIYCGQTHSATLVCPDEHFICQSCQTKQTIDLISDYCLFSKSRNPIETAMVLMKSPEFKMHCPEHHYLVPAVLLSAYCKTKRKTSKLKEWIKAAQNRATKVPGAFCGTHGSCGAAVGTGIFVSLITGATPLKSIEWNLTNSVTGRSLLRMAPYGGPRCCKRVTFLAIQEATLFLSERMGILIDIPNKINCEFSHKNEQCMEDDCPFYLN